MREWKNDIKMELMVVGYEEGRGLNATASGCDPVMAFIRMFLRTLGICLTIRGTVKFLGKPLHNEISSWN
jgi:hypothetical protein